MHFDDAFVSRQHRYAIGAETASGRRYLSIPVSSRMVDYEEHYELSPAEIDEFRSDPTAACAFAESCRRREQDHRLIVQPGTDRGTPR